MRTVLIRHFYFLRCMDFLGERTRRGKVPQRWLQQIGSVTVPDYRLATPGRSRRNRKCPAHVGLISAFVSELEWTSDVRMEADVPLRKGPRRSYVILRRRSTRPRGLSSPLAPGARDRSRGAAYHPSQGSQQCQITRAKVLFGQTEAENSQPTTNGRRLTTKPCQATSNESSRKSPRCVCQARTSCQAHKIDERRTLDHVVKPGRYSDIATETSDVIVKAHSDLAVVSYDT